MKKYKVIRDYDVLTKGDIFELTPNNTYVCRVEESDNDCTYKSTITVSLLYMAKAMKEGSVIELDPQDTTNYKRLYEKYKTSWDNTFDYLTKLAEEYQKDIDHTLGQYANDEIDECQKIERTTVYANLRKQCNLTLNKLKA